MDFKEWYKKVKKIAVHNFGYCKKDVKSFKTSKFEGFFTSDYSPFGAIRMYQGENVERWSV